MNRITLKTQINAPVKRCFNLSTSIDLHKISASKSNEEAIDGITKGLIKLNETVTWKAKHFGVWFRMKVKITEYDEPNFFVDEMISGAFKSMKHRHEFKQNDNGTLMIDKFEFSSPLGILGKIVDHLILKNYMTKFIEERNQVIVEFAESEKWKEVLKHER